MTKVTRILEPSISETHLVYPTNPLKKGVIVTMTENGSTFEVVRTEAQIRRIAKQLTPTFCV
jgi:hypothetical protein